MKVKDLLKAINEQALEDDSILEKEVMFFDYKQKKSYPTTLTLNVIDWSDNDYLDIVFNIKE